MLHFLKNLISRRFLPNTRGFTLLEMIVALGVFSILILIVIGLIFNTISTEQRIKSKQDILENVRFAVDLFGTEVTSGSAFPKDCEEGCDTFVFATKVRPDIPLRRVEYYLDADQKVIMRGEQKTFGSCTQLPLPDECYLPITTDQADIGFLQFFVNHTGENEQPVVTISIQGAITDPKTGKEDRFDIGTTFTPRLLQDPNARPPSDTIPPSIQITDPTSASSYTSSQGTIRLGGIASDNIAVTEVRWSNKQTGFSGFADPLTAGYATWQTPTIVLFPGSNNIVMEARDADGNRSTDSILVNATALLGTPSIALASLCNSTTGKPYIYISWSSIVGADDYHIDKCVGICTSASTSWTVNYRTDSVSPNFDGAVAAGTTYSYRIRAHNHTAKIFSGYSPIKSVTARTDCVAGKGKGKGKGGGDDGGSSPSFTLNADPEIIGVGVSGGSTTMRQSSRTQITATPLNGFDDDIRLSATGGPPGIVYQFSGGGEIEDDEYAKGVSFGVRIPDNTGIGTYSITITGRSGTISDSVDVTLDVSQVGGGQL